jgi:hypothetical protein
MLELKIDDKLYECEANWNQFSRKRLMQVMKVISAPGNEGMRMWKLVCVMLKLKGKAKNHFTKTVPSEVVHNMIQDKEIFGWIKSPEELLTEYTVRGFWHKGMYYIGPPTKMLRIAMEEMVGTRTAFADWTRKGNSRSLDNTIAILYRPINPLWWLKINSPEWNGDKRMPLNDWGLKRRSRKFAKLPPYLRTAITKQYSSALQDFEKRFPRTFRKTEGGGDGDNPRAWVNLLFAMSGQIFGTKRQTELTDCTEVFIKLEQDIEQSEKIKDLSKRK